MNTDTNVTILDAFNIVYKCYYSLPEMQSSNGNHTNALQGYVNILIKIINKMKSDNDLIFVAADSAKCKTFRHQIYSGYKANRKPPEESLISQFPLIEEVTKSLNIDFISKAGFEADDIIATLVRFFKKDPKKKITIMSSDKDLYQLIDHGVTMMDPVKLDIIDEEQIIKKLGIGPNQVLDYLSLVGDSADNIPGIKGVGPKTASRILNQYKSIDNILANSENLKDNKDLKKILPYIDDAQNAKKIIELKDDIDIDIENRNTSTKARIDMGNNLAFSNFLKKYDMKYIHTRIFNGYTSSPEEKEIQEVDLDTVIESSIQDDGLISIEIVNEDEIHIKTSNGELAKLSAKDFDSKKTKNLLLDSSITKISSNAYRLYEMFINISTLEDIRSLIYCKYTVPNIKIETNDIIRLFLEQRRELVINKTYNIYASLDRPMIRVLAKMKMNGVCIDSNELDVANQKFSKQIESLEEEIFSLSGYKFNIGSTKQLSEVLINKFNIELKKKSATQNYILDLDALEYLSSSGYKIADLVLNWRKLNKLQTTYVEGLKKHISKETNRVHSTYSITGTSTGRLSSNNPNIQNLPIRTSEGREIRKSIVAAKDHVLISADYSQIELRVLAYIANEDNMLSQLRAGEDIHSITAKKIFANEDDGNSRRMAKIINFGIIYGISPFGLSKQLNISALSAKTIIEKYMRQYSKIEQYLEKTLQFAKSNGFVKTLYGRKCKIPNINASNANLRKFAERAAINAPIQGTASDIMKASMISVDSFMESNKLKSKIIMQIHDEIVIEAHKDEESEVKKKIKEIMENVTKERFKELCLVVNVKSGKNMFEMQ